MSKLLQHYRWGLGSRWVLRLQRLLGRSQTLGSAEASHGGLNFPKWRGTRDDDKHPNSAIPENGFYWFNPPHLH
jgi:hypothetical protein